MVGDLGHPGGERLLAARAAAGSVPPIAKVGGSSTSADSSSRTTVPRNMPSDTEPPMAMYASRTPASRKVDTPATKLMNRSRFDQARYDPLTDLG